MKKSTTIELNKDELYLLLDIFEEAADKVSNWDKPLFNPVWTKLIGKISDFTQGVL